MEELLTDYDNAKKKLRVLVQDTAVGQIFLSDFMLAVQEVYKAKEEDWGVIAAKYEGPDNAAARRDALAQYLISTKMLFSLFGTLIQIENKSIELKDN